MRYEIRPVRPAEWERSRDLRLAALQDPVASVAFARTYAEESAMTDAEWKQRTSGAGAQQFVAVRTSPDGADEWVGMAVPVIEQDGYVCINAVYLLPQARGTGLAEKLFAAAVEWAWEHADRVHLWVHEKNSRARAFYERFGFVTTGRTMVFPLDAAMTEYEMVLVRG